MAGANSSRGGHGHRGRPRLQNITVESGPQPTVFSIMAYLPNCKSCVMMEHIYRDYNTPSSGAGARTASSNPLHQHYLHACFCMLWHAARAHANM